MRVEQLKRWQWALIGCFLGLVVAWAWGSVQDSGGLASRRHRRRRVRAAAAQPPMQGHPRIKGLTLHHDESRYWVTLKVLGPDPKDPHPKNPGGIATSASNSTRPPPSCPTSAMRRPRR